MQRRSVYLYLSIFCVHIFIALVAFIGCRLQPCEVLFSSFGDGLKNIFTLITYVREPIGPEGIFKYNGFQYPFGDYVYYTDNNPLFALPFRWFCHNVYDLSAHSIVILYAIVILNIAVCGLLIFYIFRRLIKSDTISLLFAVMLPWINMQIFRIPAGHYAFSFSSFILIAIWLLMLWHKYRDNYSRQAVVACGMLLLSFIGFVAQGYYLAIITIFISAVLFMQGIYHFKSKAGKLTLVFSIVYAVVAFAGTIGFIALTDRYLPLRKEGAGGYDWMLQKVRFAALFSHYDFQHIAFPLVSGGPRIADPEAAAYLGNVGIYALAVLLVMMLVRKEWRRHILQSQKEFFSDPLKGSLLLGSVVMLLISFGEHYYTNDDHSKGLHVVNVLNPFYYVHMVTNRVEQFRSLERFVWPFFFCYYLWVGYTIAFVAAKYGRKVKVAILAAIVFLGGAEVYDYVNMLQKQCEHQNPFSERSTAGILPTHIDVRQYQAILPIPYYFAGSEVYDYTLNDKDSWSRHNYQLSWVSGLPLMSCKMSRTPPVYNIMLMNMVANDSLADELKAKLGSKPVLVAVNRKLIADSTQNCVPDTGTPQAEYYWKATQFALRNKLEVVDSAGDVLYYKWYPHSMK
ncbi:MAG: hypothetical protein V4649_07890 [Bacteroidota bacterium]